MVHSCQPNPSDSKNSDAGEGQQSSPRGYSPPPPLEDYDYDDSSEYTRTPQDSDDETSFDDDLIGYQEKNWQSDSDEHEAVVGKDDVLDLSEEEEEEVFNVDDLYNNPENLKVEYIGKHRMAVVDQLVDDSFLENTEPSAVSRIVVIDAANILHGLTPVVFGGTSLAASEQKVDAAYILSLVRFFVSKGIECLVISQTKYMLDSVTENMFVLTTLQGMGLLMVIDYAYDDMVLFSVAGEFDGVILSEDQFRDEKNLDAFMTPNVKRALQLQISPKYPRKDNDFLPKSEWGKVSKNGHFVVDHLLRFHGTTEKLRNKLFSTEKHGGHRFELVKEKHDSWMRRKDQVLSVLDLLLARIQPIMEQMRANVCALVPRN